MYRQKKKGTVNCIEKNFTGGCYISGAFGRYYGVRNGFRSLWIGGAYAVC